MCSRRAGYRNASFATTAFPRSGPATSGGSACRRHSRAGVPSRSSNNEESGKMADIQKQIMEFDKNIRLSWEEEEKELHDKREIILGKLRDEFAKMRAEKQSVPTF